MRDQRHRCSLGSLLLFGLFLGPLQAAEGSNLRTRPLLSVYLDAGQLEGPPILGEAVTTSDGWRLQQQLEQQQLHSEAAAQHSSRLLRSAAATAAAAAAAADNVWTRPRGYARRLLANSNVTVVTSATGVNTSRVCPSSGSTAWDSIQTAGYGHLVSDNWVCSNPNSPRGLSLLVLGNQGLGGVGSCSVDAVDIAIYTDSSGAPNTLVQSVELQLNRLPGSATFTWSTNTSAVLSFDIVDKSRATTATNPPAQLVDFATKYWLRVQLLVNYQGNTGTAKCLAHWLMNDASKTGSSCLWQEAIGGSSGYSTSCLGAATGALPAADQTFASCFNGGEPGSTGTRRCATYRSSTGNSTLSCPAQFVDYRFAFYGNNAASCASAPMLSLSNGSWPGGCAGIAVGQSCAANCTWGGSASTECLVTGQWSTAIVGQCADPPTNCSAVPTASLVNGSWPVNCAGRLINQSCSATCDFGGSASVTCMFGGVWESTTTGSCADPPTNCSAVPTASLVNGSWPANCAEKLIGQSCSATCDFGGTASVTCQVNGNWESSTTGSCADPPTNCTAVPTASLVNGSWPANCAEKLVGQSCSATCDFGGSASVTCQVNGAWESSTTGSCTAAPTNCSGTPGSNPSYGSWPSSCSGTLVGETCTATCTYGGTVTSTCGISGTQSQWGASTGSCTPGATALISDSGLTAADQLVVCNLTNSAFSNCVPYSSGLTQITATFTDGSKVWMADKGVAGAGSVRVCDLDSQTNVLSNCITSTLTGFVGLRSPTGVVVKGGAAWVANEQATCGVIYCTNAAAMTDCSCVSGTMDNTLNSVTGISMSPAEDKLYVVGLTGVLPPTESIVACDLGTTTANCVTYPLTHTSLTGMYATNTKLYMYDAGLSFTSRVLICDVANPSSCTTSSTEIGSGLLALGVVVSNGPWGLSTFDGMAYVPDNDNVLICSNVDNISGCSSQSALTILGAVLSSTAGAHSIFLYPRV